MPSDLRQSCKWAKKFKPEPGPNSKILAQTWPELAKWFED